MLATLTHFSFQSSSSTFPALRRHVCAVDHRRHRRSPRRSAPVRRGSPLQRGPLPRPLRPDSAAGAAGPSASRAAPPRRPPRSPSRCAMAPRPMRLQPLHECLFGSLCRQLPQAPMPAARGAPPGSLTVADLRRRPAACAFDAWRGDSARGSALRREPFVACCREARRPRTRAQECGLGFQRRPPDPDT